MRQDPDPAHEAKNRVHSPFALREAGACVWIWMGDQGAIICDPPGVGFQVAEDPSQVHGWQEVAANRVLIRENVFDLTLIAFLHKNTFKLDNRITTPDT